MFTHWEFPAATPFRNMFNVSPSPRTLLRATRNFVCGCEMQLYVNEGHP